jgi:hypothetical protein
MAIGRVEKEFSNVIGGEQKFVGSPFTVDTNGQFEDNILQNVYMAVLFVSFGTKSLSGG